jgi:hypothetical protein
MAISDVLFEASNEIERYLNEGFYAAWYAAHETEILKLVSEMRRVQRILEAYPVTGHDQPQ